MTMRSSQTESFFGSAHPIVRVVLTRVRGSSPREAGTEMFVAPNSLFGTIGGGQLEHIVITQARSMLAEGTLSSRLDMPLGPEIGQCCGGRVGLAISVVDDGVRAVLMAETEAEDARLPAVYVFGGGHVGHALAQTLALLPVRATIVETRADAILDFPLDIETRLTAVPEEIVREAPAGSAFVVLTHDHALDFLIVAEALRRTDTAYVGMIGSATKKATFKSWYLKNAGGSEDAFARLVCPIGGDAVRDKRPAVIAALAAAEILAALATA